MLGRFGVLLLLLPLAGCSQPQDDAMQQEAPPGARSDGGDEAQTFTGGFDLSTHAGCFVATQPVVDEFMAATPVDERSKGERFVAYINVTDEVQVLFARVQFYWPEDPDPAAHTYEGAAGEAIWGRVPVTAAPVVVFFDVCGTTGAGTVWYHVPLVPA